MRRNYARFVSGRTRLVPVGAFERDDVAGHTRNMSRAARVRVNSQEDVAVRGPFAPQSRAPDSCQKSRAEFPVLSLIRESDSRRNRQGPSQRRLPFFWLYPVIPGIAIRVVHHIAEALLREARVVIDFAQGALARHPESRACRCGRVVFSRGLDASLACPTRLHCAIQRSGLSVHCCQTRLSCSTGRATGARAAPGHSAQYSDRFTSLPAAHARETRPKSWRRTPHVRPRHERRHRRARVDGTLGGAARTRRCLLGLSTKPSRSSPR
jgi:hypothetical protein